MQSAVSVADQASAMLTWMRSLDLDHDARIGLLTSEVRTSSVWALYPPSFHAIQPGLCKHLRTYGARGLKGREQELSSLLVDLHFVWQMLAADAETLMRRDQQFESPNGRFHELEAELKSQFTQARLTSDKAVFTSSAMWYCWWYLSHPELIPPAGVESVEAAAAFFGEHLLHLKSLGIMP